MKRVLTMLAAAAGAAALAAEAPAQSTATREAPAPAVVPAEDFGALPYLTAPDLSADGRRLVATSFVGGTKSVVLLDLAAADGGLTKIDIPKDYELNWAVWLGSRGVLISIVVPSRFYGLELPASRLIMYDVAAGQLRPVTGRIGGMDGDDVIHIDPEGRFFLLSAQRGIFDTPAVLRVDAETLVGEQIVKPHHSVWSWYVDPKGVVRAGLGTDAKRWWLLYRNDGAGEFRKIARGRHGEEAFTDVETVIPAANGDKGYAIANKATGRYGVYRYDFASDTVGEPVFEHGEVDVETVAFSGRTGEIDAIFYTDDRPRVEWLSPEMKSIQQRIDRALPGAVNRIISRDKDDANFLVSSSSPSNPGAYYHFDRAKRELRELARPYHQLDGATLSPTEPVRYSARDGLGIPGYLTLPAGKRAEKLPLIVMPHGGPFTRDTWGYEPWVQFLANRGYAVLQPNFRGSTGYGKTFVEAATGQFGRKMQDDLDDGVAWLVERGIADPKRVCMMGASYGGYAAMWAAVRNPDIYRCAISFAGISDMPSMLRYDRRRWVATRYYRDWRDRIRGDKNFDLDDISPLDRAGELRIPLLIAHGEKDRTVPMGQSKRLHEALGKAGIAHEYVIYPEEGHGFSKVENSVDFLKRVEAFLAKHNPAGK